MEYDDHDPWNDPSHRHPRAAELMADDKLWDCVNELSPFGSDEGADAYCEFRRWRADSPSEELTGCISWILGGRLDEYLKSTASVGSRTLADKSADSLGYPDAFTLDATILATVLGQLVDEGRIDPSAKPFGYAAISRQSHPMILGEYGDEAVEDERRGILEVVRRIVEAA